MFTLCCGRKPFDDESEIGTKELMDKILFVDPIICSSVSDELKDLISNLLKKHFTKRIGFKGRAKSVNTHPVFKATNWKDLTDQHTTPTSSFCEYQEIIPLQQSPKTIENEDLFDFNIETSRQNKSASSAQLDPSFILQISESLDNNSNQIEFQVDSLEGFN